MVRWKGLLTGQNSSRPPTPHAAPGGWALDSLDEYDTPAEVDASMRTLRRVAIWHFAVFLGVVLLVPLLTVALDWWSRGRLVGGISPNFAMAAVGLYVFFFVISFAAARLSNAVENRMLGHSQPGIISDDAEPFDGDGRHGLPSEDSLAAGDRPHSLSGGDGLAGGDGLVAGADRVDTDDDSPNGRAT
ncbi:hypothetical protein [Phytoactinopolyspora endophytica]|uniref:hypothetical protein n=1 Tax=Phytoactinopolyspora endophytica TaxID=1642495 RepID=UPI00197BA577|nr:hypothetical protein [Phytoactinopolyspora endophytica]